MKTKSLKKIFATLAVVVSLLILASLTLVGCGNKKEDPKSFADIFEVTEVKEWEAAEAKAGETLTIDGLNTAKLYKTVTFTVKEGQAFTMKSFSFSMDAGEAVKDGGNLSWNIAIKNTSNEAVAVAGNGAYDFAKGGKQDFTYEWKFESTETNTNVVWNTFLPTGSTITLTFGVPATVAEKAEAPTLNTYKTAIKLSNFAIA